MVVYLGSAALLCLRNYWLLGRGQAIKNYTSVLPIRDLLSLFLRTKNGPFFFFFCSHVSLQTRSCSDTRVHETLSGCGSMIGQHGGGYISGKSFLPLLFLTICNLSFQARRPLKFSGAFFKKGYYRPPLILYHAVHRPASPSFHAPLPLSSHSEAKWEEVRVSERPGTNVWEPSAMPDCAFAPDVCSVFFFFSFAFDPWQISNFVWFLLNHRLTLSADDPSHLLPRPSGVFKTVCGEKEQEKIIKLFLTWNSEDLLPMETSDSRQKAWSSYKSIKKKFKKTCKMYTHKKNLKVSYTGKCLWIKQVERTKLNLHLFYLWGVLLHLLSLLKNNHFNYEVIFLPPRCKQNFLSCK